MASHASSAMIISGILIIVFALFLGYGLYQAQQSPSKVPLQNSQSASINSSISSLTTDLGTTLNNNMGTFIRLIILYLFANIGYKIAYLGIEMRDKEPKPKNTKKNE